LEPGEDDVTALVRECVEELGARIEVGQRVGEDVVLSHGRALLRVYAARLLDGEVPQPLEHEELRWLAVSELDSVEWLPADAPIVAALPPFLAAPNPFLAAPNPGLAAPNPGPLTYREIGATRSDQLPAGYHHVRRRVRVGTGADAFRAAASAVAHWQVQRGAGLLLREATPTPEVGGRVTVGLGVRRLRVWAPAEVVWVADERDRYGFAYGTLPGHPEIGEEAFVVTREAEDAVWFEIRAFSRPGTWYARLGGPIARWVQSRVTDRYVAAVEGAVAAAEA
jgi:uncharacterized protein (UPF0548 family)